MSMFKVMGVPLEKVGEKLITVSKELAKINCYIDKNYSMEVEQKPEPEPEPEPENSIKVYSATIKIIFFSDTEEGQHTGQIGFIANTEEGQHTGQIGFIAK